MGIKSRLKKRFCGRLAISYLHCAESFIVPKLIGDETAVKRFYKRNTGKELDLENPKSFSEKMNWYKLNARHSLMQQCADKYAVREYVESKGYGDCLNRLLGVYDKVSDIDIDALPERFVLKASHGSHMNIIVKDNKNKINWRQQKMMMRSWLRQNIYWSGREWVYKDIPKRIIAEEYLEDETGELKDYKFFCFNGISRFMQLDGGRFTTEQYRNYYDMNMKLLPFCDVGTPNNKEEAFPVQKELFTKMEKIANNLASPFQFVRVDFYVVNGKIYVGELTFFDSGGSVEFSIPEYDDIIGRYWKLED